MMQDEGGATIRFHDTDRLEQRIRPSCVLQSKLANNQIECCIYKGQSLHLHIGIEAQPRMLVRVMPRRRNKSKVYRIDKNIPASRCVLPQ